MIDRWGVRAWRRAPGFVCETRSILIVGQTTAPRGTVLRRARLTDKQAVRWTFAWHAGATS
jgi:hypothetical protein